MSEEMRTFGYLCPKCGKPVMGTRSIFALEASDAEIACECGGSVLRTEYDGRDYRVYVPCGLCSETHMAILPAGADAPWRHRPGLFPNQAVLLLYRPRGHCGKEPAGAGDSR